VTRQINLRVSDRLYGEFQRVARERGLPLSRLIRETAETSLHLGRSEQSRLDRLELDVRERGDLTAGRLDDLDQRLRRIELLAEGRS
jgi:hypothetical protein